MTSLTPPERETVVLMSDEDDVAIITTWQRKVITKLERNPAAVKLEEWRHGTSRGARYQLPAALVSFRSKARRGGPGNPAALAAARAKRDAA